MPQSKEPRIDLRGLVVGRLTVIEQATRLPEHRGPMWTCQCSCGTVKAVPGVTLRKGLSTSCGCWRRERIGRDARRHGGHGTAEYRTWRNMRQRCELSTNIGYSRYGGRGITVCERWRESFPNFLADMGLRPSQQHSIDRINNDGNYEPTNCRWATREEQAANRELHRRYLTHDGQTKPLQEWLKEIPVSRMTLFTRLAKGWSDSDALTKPRYYGRRHRSGYV